MKKLLVDLLIFPFKLGAWLIEFLGRSAAIFMGLIGFGLGALMWFFPPLTLIGAPLCLISGIVVIKAL